MRGNNLKKGKNKSHNLMQTQLKWIGMRHHSSHVFFFLLIKLTAAWALLCCLLYWCLTTQSECTWKLKKLIRKKICYEQDCYKLLVSTETLNFIMINQQNTSFFSYFFPFFNPWTFPWPPFESVSSLNFTYLHLESKAWGLN